MTDKDKDYYSKSLYEALKHGDAEHSAWLYDAIYAYFHDQPVPPVKGGSKKEARVIELESLISDLYWKTRENAITPIFDKL